MKKAHQGWAVKFGNFLIQLFSLSCRININLLIG
jgi:hypothetical protein